MQGFKDNFKHLTSSSYILLLLNLKSFFAQSISDIKSTLILFLLIMNTMYSSLPSFYGFVSIYKHTLLHFQSFVTTSKWFRLQNCS